MTQYPSNLEIDTPITLTEGQEKALEAFVSFLSDPLMPVFVLEGYAGCGKSTLVKTILDRLSTYQQTVQLLDPDSVPLDVMLTATTNKAAEALADATGRPVSTIHSALGIRPEKNLITGESVLVSNKAPVEYRLIFIDEASFAGPDLFQLIFKQTKNCKIVFIGDPAQLLDMQASYSPAFNAGFPTAKLTEVVRQAKGNPIIDLATKFRETVNTGEFFSFLPDGHHIQHMSYADFDAALLAEFARSDWKFSDSKVLAWTNRAVNEYNKYIRENAHGKPLLQEGDYAVCNSFIQLPTGLMIRTDQMVRITEDLGTETLEGVTGRQLIIDGKHDVFLPDSYDEHMKAIKMAQMERDYNMARGIASRWIDLRAAYACTANKSQGSTFGKVFIDLDDISRCRNPNTLARLLYVATSRAKTQVIFTGDIV